MSGSFVSQDGKTHRHAGWYMTPHKHARKRGRQRNVRSSQAMLSIPSRQGHKTRYVGESSSQPSNICGQAQAHASSASGFLSSVSSLGHRHRGRTLHAFRTLRFLEFHAGGGQLGVMPDKNRAITSPDKNRAITSPDKNRAMSCAAIRAA
eukprot:scaffold9389_cov193-Isochrysis_galbana.AAC.1